jgi:hypothetical protein
MSAWFDTVGTRLTEFAIGFSGAVLKSVGAKLQIRNSGDTAFADLVARDIELGGGDTVLQSGAPGTPVTFTLPDTTGSPGHALVTDGTGLLSFQPIAGGTDKLVVDTTSLAFGSAATVAMFSLPANAEILEIRVIVDTAFNTAATMSVGLAGDVSKYAPATALNLQSANAYHIYPNLPPVGGAEDLIITYASAGATAGAARILVSYVIPS